MHWVNNLIEMNEQTEQSEGVKAKIPVRSQPHARSYLSDRLSHLQYFFFFIPLSQPVADWTKIRLITHRRLSQQRRQRRLAEGKQQQTVHKCGY